MEEDTLLANIATIVTKEILADDGTNCLKNYSYNLHSNAGNIQSTFLESDDEAHNFFIEQQKLLNQNRTNSSNPNVKKSTKRVALFPLLEDEAHNFFIKQHKLMHQNKFQSRNRNVKNKALKNERLDVAATKSITTNCFQSLTSEKETVLSTAALEVNLLNEFDAFAFENYLHLNKATFLKIFKSLRHLLTRTTATYDVPPPMPPQTVFSLALWKLTTDEHFEEISRRFHMPLHNCHLVIRQFWHMVSESYESFIKWPNSRHAQQVTITDFQTTAALKTFKQLFGIIAIKRLDIFLESEDEEVSVILQIICNANEKIIDCFVEFANAYSFDNTPIGQTLDMNAETIPAASYIIGDCSFPLRRYLVRPFEIECFRNETIFNRMLQPALNMGQRVLENMAQRFHTLYALEAKDISEVRKVLETVCSLHNLCIEHGDDYVRNRQVAAVSLFETTPSTNQLHSVSTIKGNEHNQQGKKTRFELMESVVINNQKF